MCIRNLRRHMKGTVCLILLIYAGYMSVKFWNLQQTVQAVDERILYSGRRPELDHPVDINESLRKVCQKFNLTLEHAKNGSGEYGEKVKTQTSDLSANEAKEWHRGYDYSGYNVYISDRLALRRRMPDFVPAMCKNVTYSSNLPQASVIIPYHKEALSALMRTVLSALDRSPDHLLKEIILVDDFSEADQLLKPLDEFLALLPKVQVIRNTEREGLMRTRMKGIMAATAPVVVIKDAHTEYFPGWLEPLLATIVANRSTIAMSNVQFMNHDDFAISAVSPTGVHAFDLCLWQVVYNVEARKNPTEPVMSPGMLGTEFAIDKEFFLRLGGYDPGMEIWGGEEMELSFKTWMCGGSMVVVPCSCVAHLFRHGSHRVSESYTRNKARVAEIWMDQYKDDVYERMGKELEGIDIGDISARVKLRADLGCHSFDWYLQNIASMVYVATDKIIQGEIHNVGDSDRCLTSTPYPGKDTARTSKCSGKQAYEFWIWTKSGQVRKDTTCLSDKLEVSECKDDNRFQFWEYDESKRMKNKASGLCLSLEQDHRALGMKTCSDESHQKWTFVSRKHPMSGKA